MRASFGCGIADTEVRSSEGVRSCCAVVLCVPSARLCVLRWLARTGMPRRAGPSGAEAEFSLCNPEPCTVKRRWGSCMVWSSCMPCCVFQSGMSLDSALKRKVAEVTNSACIKTTGANKAPHMRTGHYEEQFTLCKAFCTQHLRLATSPFVALFCCFRPRKAPAGCWSIQNTNFTFPFCKSPKKNGAAVHASRMHGEKEGLPHLKSVGCWPTRSAPSCPHLL
jgi:hypothetical protein